jgi:hypothetical protein
MVVALVARFARPLQPCLDSGPLQSTVFHEILQRSPAFARGTHTSKLTDVLLQARLVLLDEHVLIVNLISQISTSLLKSNVVLRDVLASILMKLISGIPIPLNIILKTITR